LDLAEDIFEQLLADPEFLCAADYELLSVIDLCLEAIDDHRFRKGNPGQELRRRLDQGWSAAS
jgi:hypothetical protein